MYENPNGIEIGNGDFGPPFSTPNSSTSAAAKKPKWKLDIRSADSHRRRLPPDVSLRMKEALKKVSLREEELNYMAIARATGVGLLTVARNAKKIGLFSTAQGGTPLSGGKYKAIDDGLYQKKSRAAIIRELHVNKRTILKREAHWKQSVCKLNLGETQKRLQEILGEVLKGEWGSRSIAAERLGITVGYLSNIIHGRQPVPIDCLDENGKNWGNVFETHYKEAWNRQNKFEFRLLLEHLAALTAAEKAQQKLQGAALTAIEKEQRKSVPEKIHQAHVITISDDFSDAQRCSFGRALHQVRIENGDTPESFVRKAKRPDLTAPLLNQIEEGNRNIKVEVFQLAADAACRVYGVKISALALAQFSNPSTPRQGQRADLAILKAA